MNGKLKLEEHGFLASYLVGAGALGRAGPSHATATQVKRSGGRSAVSYQLRPSTNGSAVGDVRYEGTYSIH